MTLHDALSKSLRQGGYVYPGIIAKHLAPIIERALVAAYNEGIYDVEVHSAGNSDHGVTAGVAAMVEG